MTSYTSMRPPLNLVFRVDASSTIGAGHLMRCLTLAAALKSAGAHIDFICRDLPGNYACWLRQRDYRVFLLPAASQPLQDGENEYLRWLSVPMETEIAQCKSVLDSLPKPDWIVVDHYALDRKWEAAVRPENAFLMAIDDLANRTHDCQFLLDQNHYPNPAQRYRDRAPGAALLLGPEYALLRPEFRAKRPMVARRTGKVHRLLVFLGGSDNANVTPTALRALTRLNYRSIDVEVVVGQANPHLEEVRAQCRLAGAKLLTQVDDMAERMAMADLAIGATGVATWERASVGLPALAISVSDNQREIARYADQLGILRWLGDASTVHEQDWVDALQWAFSNGEALREQSVNGMQVVDGLGTTRVVERMIGHHSRLH